MAVEEQTVSSAAVMTRHGRRVLIIVENLPCPFDRRVWQEARTLASAGYVVSIICPKAPGYQKSFERIDGIDIHRHRLPTEADGVLGYALEYSVALAMEFPWAATGCVEVRPIRDFESVRRAVGA